MSGQISKLVKQSALTAERAGQTVILEDDVLSAYEISKYVLLSSVARAVTSDETSLLYQIADMAIGTESSLTSGAVYEMATKNVQMSYAWFYEKLRSSTKCDWSRSLTRTKAGGPGR